MMKIILPLVLAAVVNVCEAQYNPRPTKSRFFNSKHSTFQVKPGDILVYSVNKNGEKHDLIVTVKKYGDLINFNYNMPQKKQTGTVNIESNSVKSTVNYDNDFINNNTLSDKSSIWLSRQNWRDLASVDKKTTMDFGGGTETFVRENASTLKIKYKGKDKLVTVYNISNQNADSKKAFTVLTDENNPLIISMSQGGTFTLKEVR
jgi:hypothetical protein